MRQALGFFFMAATALSLTSCCCDRDSYCEPCPPKPRCYEPRPCCPQPCPPPKCEPRYFDNNGY